VTTVIRRWWLPVLAAMVVAVSVVWGWHVQADPNVKLGAAPLVGRWHLRFGPSLVPAALLAALVVWRGQAWAQRVRFGRIVAATAAAAVAFTLLLAASDGPGHVLDPVVHPTEYWANLATLPDARTMLHHYASVPFLIPYSVHAKGHQPISIGVGVEPGPGRHHSRAGQPHRPGASLPHQDDRRRAVAEQPGRDQVRSRGIVLLDRQRAQLEPDTSAGDQTPSPTPWRPDVPRGSRDLTKPTLEVAIASTRRQRTR